MPAQTYLAKCFIPLFLNFHPEAVPGHFQKSLSGSVSKKIPDAQGRGGACIRSLPRNGRAALPRKSSQPCPDNRGDRRQNFQTDYAFLCKKRQFPEFSRQALPCCFLFPGFFHKNTGPGSCADKPAGHPWSSSRRCQRRYPILSDNGALSPRFRIHSCCGFLSSPEASG